MTAFGTTLPAPGSRLPGAAQTVLTLLGALRGGRLDITLPSGAPVTVGEGPHRAGIEILDWRVFEHVMAKGAMGLAEDYVEGLWRTDQLTALLTLMAQSRDQIARACQGNVLRLLGYRLLHALRTNTRAGSRRNIQAHYDIGNDFYALWLDSTMSYSAALFTSPEQTLEDAQRAKYRRILQRLGVAAGARILEIGCGWGGFAEVAAQAFGCAVLGLTLSPAQLDYARARAEQGGWSQAAQFELCDYRDVRGQYDHIVSIEMYEAVGERYWPTYFARLADLLRPGGKALVQGITIADAQFADYRRNPDFIQRYIFPGGMLASPSVFRREAERQGLALGGDYAFGLDYARTLAHWHHRFEAARDAVRAQGYDERFIRLWRFYLAYCEAGFRAGSIDVHQYELCQARSVPRGA